ncbi:MAG: hypothetical protein J6Y19_06655, partial [Kiritimatiellae bacterium]|nr:hypothetical protein [Kiritimatiellia bacterium]
YMPPSRSSAGVWVRSQGGEEGYFIDLCGAGDMAVVSFEEGKKIREIKRVPVAVETVRDGKPWTVRVRGDEIMVEHEGRCFLKVRDSKFPVGTVGVEGIHVPMAFSGLEVRQLDTTSGRYAGTRCGRKRPGRVFPEWKPEEAAADSGAGLEAELRALVVQGRRDRAASPEFLEALEGVLARHAGAGEKASDQLPLKPAFRGPGMPAGWRAVAPSVWRFGEGEARQVESKANTRYVLYYEPGMAWRDYAVTLRFESDRWFPPPANSCAALWVRYKGVDDAYSVNFDGNGNVSVISCEQGGKGRVIARTAAGEEVIKDGKPWMVRAKGEEIVVEHEGRCYLEVHDGTHREGTVGLESIHIPMKFSGVKVQ